MQPRMTSLLVSPPAEETFCGMRLDVVLVGHESHFVPNLGPYDRKTLSSVASERLCIRC